MNTNSALMDWLRVQMLRLRSFDWQQGSWHTQQLKDGVIKFGFDYAIDKLIDKLGVDEEQILDFIDSGAALEEMAGKSFTASWSENRLRLSWLEEGVLETKVEISTHYFEDQGKYFVRHRWIEKIVYLDNTERVTRDSGEGAASEISQEEFFLEANRIKATEDST